MKLFDFKFLILLGLTLVVYFMYKEIDIQRERIQQLEDTYRRLLDKDHNHEEEDEVLSLPPPPQKNLLINKKDKIIPDTIIKPEPINNPDTIIKQDIVVIDVAPEIPIKPVNNLKLELPSKMIKKTSDTTEEESESTTSSSSNSNTDKKAEILNNNHLEIYSNDNENIDETSISDTLINKDISKKSSESLEDILNNLELNNLDLEINEKKSPKIDITSLSKLKLGELQDLAKKENINLDKKVNGVNKKKTKQELIDEIIEIQKKISN